MHRIAGSHYCMRTDSLTHVVADEGTAIIQPSFYAGWACATVYESSTRALGLGGSPACGTHGTYFLVAECGF